MRTNCPFKIAIFTQTQEKFIKKLFLTLTLCYGLCFGNVTMAQEVETESTNESKTITESESEVETESEVEAEVETEAEAKPKFAKYYIGYNYMPVSHELLSFKRFAEEKAILASFGYDHANLRQSEGAKGSVLYAGQKLSENFSLELALKNYGEKTFTYIATENSSGVTYSTTQKISISSVNIGCKYIWKRKEKFNLYAKLGSENWSSTSAKTIKTNDPRLENVLDVYDTRATIDSGDDLYYGVGMDIKGLQFEIAPRNFQDENGEELISTLLQIGYAFSF